MVWTFITLNWLDLALTFYALSLGAVELNPIAVSPVTMISLKVLVTLCALLALRLRLVFYPLIAFYLFVVLWNSVVIVTS